MRRTTKALPALAGLALLVTACGGDDATPTPGAGTTPTNTPTSAAPSASGTLTIWADDTRARPLTEVGKKFQTEKGVTVKVVQKDFGKIRDDLISQGPTGNGPDVIVGAHDWLGKLVQNGAVAPVELGDKKAQFTEVSVSAMSYEGQVYGLPYAVENIAFFRNTTLAPNAPKDFNDAIATGKRLVASGKAKLPMAIQQDPKSGDPYHLYPLQTSFGAPVFGTKADGSYDVQKLELDNAGGLKFAQALSRLGKEKVLTASVSGDIAKNSFQKGQTPYIITGPWNTADFTKAGVKYVVEKVPSLGGQPAKPFVGVQGFMVSKYSKNGLLANEFVVNYLGTEDVAKTLYETGGRPPALTAVFDQVKSDPIIAGFGEVGAEGQPLPAVPAMDNVWAEWGTTELAIIRGKGNPEQLWKAMATKIRAKIK
jgi:arabinogalactan oligomer/maltooligosaccharide transport system substrate-binding protein